VLQPPTFPLTRESPGWAFSFTFTCQNMYEVLVFSGNYLPVLVCTSTLALGVNLPAQLVIIKSTQQMVKVRKLIAPQQQQKTKMRIHMTRTNKNIVDFHADNTLESRFSYSISKGSSWITNIKSPFCSYSTGIQNRINICLIAFVNTVLYI